MMQEVINLITGSGEFAILCYLATDPESRSRGLMGVRHLEPYAGMLFIYQEPTISGFWMKDTLLPLTVIWFGNSGDYIGHSEMVPLSEHSVTAPGEYWFALEILTPVANAIGLGPGTRFTPRSHK